jgi:hypothetical protein
MNNMSTLKRAGITVLLTVFSVLFCEAQNLRDAIEQQKQQETTKQQGTAKQQDNQAESRVQWSGNDALSQAQQNVSVQLLTETDLRGLTKPQLRILRNTVFALHGRKFASKDLQEYFGAMEWYRPKYDEVTHLLNNIEKKNVEFIQKHE